jgi:hypothetical protein
MFCNEDLLGQELATESKSIGTLAATNKAMMTHGMNASMPQKLAYGIWAIPAAR